MAMRPLPAATAAVAAEMSAERSLLSSPAHTMTSTPTHTSCTEGTPSYTTSSPSCCSSELTGRNVSIDYLPRLNCKFQIRITSSPDQFVLSA